MAISRLQDGLDVSSPDATTAEEIEAYRAAYRRTNKGLLNSFEFWLEFRPDVLKRHKARTRHFLGDDGVAYPLAAMLATMHQFTIGAFQDGIGYEMRLSQTNGATRGDILDTLSVAFIHSGHPGMYAADAHRDYLRDYEEPEPASTFPTEWSFDPGAFDSGMDYSTREASADDIDRLVTWYERTLGEVPRYVGFLGRHRPGLLKSYRDRYEHAIRDSLPKQMLPYLMLHYNTVRGFGEGIREHVLLGRATGMSREQLLDAVCSAVLHAGVNALGVVDQAAGDLFAAE